MQSKNLHQSKNLASVIAGQIKLIGFALLCSFLISQELSAQTFLDCNNINESPRDAMQLLRVSGNPRTNDTVWMRVSVSTDSTMSGFVFLIKWDPAKVKPLQVYDPIGAITYVITQQTGRFVKTNALGDTITNFFSQISQNPFDSGAIICGYNLAAADSLVTTPAGSGVIFRIGFELFTSMTHNDSALVRFYEIQPVFIPPTGPPIVLDCRRSEISVDWNNSGAPVTLYPRSIDGYIVADTAPEPAIVNFTPQNSTIQAGTTTGLNYDVKNVDSIRITGTNFTYGAASPTPNGTLQGVAVITPNPTVSTTYTMRAYNANGISIDSSARVTVTTGGGGGNPNAPAISFPDGNSFTIEQGQTTSFRVRATDPDVGNTVTLEATALPNNSSFAKVVGTTTVEGTFSFTPDFNQEGTFSVTFKATDNTFASNTASASINVTALQFDRLFTTSAIGQSPVGGLKGKRDIVFPINVVTQQTVYGVQFDMAYDRTILKIDSFTLTPRTPDYVVYDDIGGSPGQVRVLIFGLANDSIITDTTSTAILQSYWSLDSSAVPWTDYLVDLSNGRESVDPNPAVPGLDMLTDDGIIQADNRGDVNLDKHMDVADLVNIVSYIIGTFGLPPRQFATADIMINDTVNVFDLVGTINTIFGIPISPVPPPPVQSEPAVLALAYNNLYPGQTDIMMVKSDLPVSVAAAELNLKYDPAVMALGAPQLGADANGMALQYKFDGKGNVKVLLHFTNPFNAAQQLPAGAGIEMIKIPMLAARTVEFGNTNQVKLNKALLSTSNSASLTVAGLETEPILPQSFELFQNYPNPFNPTTTIMFTIGTAADGSLTQPTSLDIYNILGQRVKTLVDDNLPPGRYQIEWNSTNENRQRVASGVYFYRIIVGSNSQSKKMLLVK